MKVIKRLVLILELTEMERIWLRGASQNPIGDVRLEDEPIADRELREAFFEATDPNEP